MPTPAPARSRPTLLAALALIAIGAAAFILHFSAPSDLLNDDQLRPAAYTLDIIANNRWIVQTDFTGAIASKPPLYTWTSALLSLPAGRVTELTLYLPCALAITGAALLILTIGRAPFGLPAATIAGAVFILSPYGFKHVALARTDAMFVFWVTLTAVLTWRAWRTGRGIDWTLLWLAVAAATLTKGPLGLLLGLSGLLAALWEWRDARRAGGGSPPHAGKRRLTPLIAGNAAGLALFLLIAGGWFSLAWKEAGQPFIDRIIGRELVGHIVGASKEHLKDITITERLWAFASGLVKPSFYFITRFAPWSIFTILGIARAIRNPAADPRERRLERFCICWFVPGLVLFSVVPHQRADLLLPLVPAAALLAGHEVRRLSMAWPARMQLGAVAAVLAVAFAGAFYEHHIRAGRSDSARRFAGLRSVAEEVRPLLGSARFYDADAPPIQWFFGAKSPRITVEAAMEKLAGAEPVLIAVRGDDLLDDRLRRLDAPVRIIARWPRAEDRRPIILILTNAPENPAVSEGE